MASYIAHGILDIVSPCEVKKSVFCISIETQSVTIYELMFDYVVEGSHLCDILWNISVSRAIMNILCNASHEIQDNCCNF